ncbi:hypothetical protein DFH09DRAFT_1327160 [Mycena vulgaris]|nr:hypothetical protein DFH09DRAFT_1327160 [Mycena vulgaris]
MPPVSLSFPPSLDSTIGALEIGILAAIYLFGLVTGQVYVYFSQHSNDPWGLKLLVGLVWSLDLGHTVAISHCIYTLTVTENGRLDGIDVLPRSLDVSIIISGLIGPLEQVHIFRYLNSTKFRQIPWLQGWFAYRLYKFSKRLFLPTVCLSLSLLRVGGSIGLSTIALRGLPLPEFEAKSGWLITAILVIGVSVDFTLTLALCYHLQYWRNGGFRRLASQITTWTIETGSITMFGGISILVTFLTVKETFVWIGCFVLLSKLFSNSLLLSLNSRARFSRIVEEVMSANARSSVPAGEIPLSTSPGTPTQVYSAPWVGDLPLSSLPGDQRLDNIVEEEEEALSGTGTFVQTPTPSVAFGSPRADFSNPASKDKAG